MGIFFCSFKERGGVQMPDAMDDELTCPRCRNEVKDSDEFCPHCGELFADGVMCENHHERAADGVCIVCALPLCRTCGGSVSGRFLCNRHSTYEIYEGMVRVYGVLDDLAAQYAKTCLEQAGFHPMIYCRSQPKGGPRFVYTLYRAAGDYDGHVINEIKVMVPCAEVVEAEKILAGLTIAQGNGT
jgi:zinc-ribbon domain